MRSRVPFIFGFVLLLLFHGVPSRAQVVDCSPGPWGELRYSKVFLEVPESTLQLFASPPAATMWRFPEYSTAEELIEYLESTAQSRPAVVELFRKEIALQELPEDEEVRAFPSKKAILAIPPDILRKIYAKLSAFSGNRYHYRPVFIDSTSPREWFAPLNLPAPAIELIEQLSYPVGDSTLAFSDVPLLFQYAARVEEDRALRRAVTRSQTLVLELEIPADANAAKALADYWTVDGKVKSTAPLLESVLRVTEPDNTIDPSNFFPAVPKKYLYEFPSSGDGLGGVFPDSIWTSFNFFRAFPETPEVETTSLTARLSEKYESIDAASRYGDMVVFRNTESGNIVHACVYVADDIVLTKNDRSQLTPWVLMKLDNVKARFSWRGEIEISTWRPLLKGNAPRATGQ